MEHRRFFTLKQAFTLPLVLIPLVLAAVFLLLFRQYSVSAADTAANRVLAVWSHSVASHLDTFLGYSFKLSSQLAEEIDAQGLHDGGDDGMEEVEAYIRRLMPRVVRDIPSVTYVAFGATNGDFVGIRRIPDANRLTAMRRDRRTEGHLVALEGGRFDRQVGDFGLYDARIRPWYQAGLAADGPVWSPIYANWDERADLTVSAVQPVRLSSGLLVGVTDIDTNLNHLSDYLRQLKGDSGGDIAIIDAEGCLVAHSRPESVAVAGDQGCGGTTARRLPLVADSSALLRAVAEHIQGQERLRIRAGADDITLFAEMVPYRAPGLNWRIVVALPESEVLGDIRASQRGVTIMTMVVLVFGLMFGLWLVNHLAQPIRTAARAAKELARGEWPSPLTGTPMVSEAEELVSAFNVMVGRLEQSFGRLRQQICVDSLTGVLTRAGFTEEFDRLAEQGGGGVLFRLGLDRFRTINDGVGYHTGDVLLAAVAERIARETGDNALIGRFAGDEFVALIPGDDPEQWANLGRRLLAAFLEPFPLGGDELRLSVCIGYVGGELEGGCRDLWIGRAGLAMTEAKRRGPGSLLAFAPEMELQAGDTVRLIGDLGRAVADGELRVHYQPICRLSDRALVGCEALVRWNHPRRGWISPAQFIPLAEESPLILSLGQFVLETACRQMRQWLDQGVMPDDADVHVNVSGRQLMQSDYLQQLEATLRRTGLPPHNLAVEVTESCLLPQGLMGTSRLAELRGMEVKIAIDDFGTGYSSLAYLHQVPFTCLKLDQSFVRRLSDDETSRSIVGAVTNLSRAFSAEVVAEGIETEIQLTLLHRMGCGLGQGYLLGRPMAAEDFSRAVAERVG